MAVNSTPVVSWLSTLNAGQALAAGSAITATVQVTGNWEIQVPCGARYGANVSLATAINVYPSSDWAAAPGTFDTVPMIAFAIPAVASVKQVLSVRLTTGIYLVALVTSSPSVSVFILTQQVVDHVTNV